MDFEKGTACKIYSYTSNLICIGKIDSIENDFINVSKTKYNFPIYPRGSSVAIVSQHNTDHVIYKASVSTSSASSLVLNDIAVLTSQNRRNFFRVNVNIDTYCTVQSSYDQLTLPIFIHNISCSGLLLETSETLEIDSILNIEIPIDNKKSFKLNVKVLRIVNMDSDETFYFGCEFIDNTNKSIDLLYSQVLKYEQQMISLLLKQD